MKYIIQAKMKTSYKTCCLFININKVRCAKNQHGNVISYKYFSNTLSKYVKSSTKWKPTIGLEIHAQIAAKSKLFSGASTEFAKPVNSCVSLFDCAIPGSMPVLNRKCVEAAVLTALALSCTLNEISLFERKHYFYPDLPAGFQITQQKQPLAINGKLDFPVFNPNVHKTPFRKVSKIKQIQLEQDSGRSLHDASLKRNLIDLNRAGVPLMELVFEPDLCDGEEAAAAVKELIRVLQTLGTCSCKMEEGALRVDTNVSVSCDDNILGVRTEIKNINTVRAVANAINYEVKRQIAILESGGKVTNETRAWDIFNKKTVLLREKEEKQDYRFMPETNLLPLRIYINEHTTNKSNLIDAVALKKQLPELPNEIRRKLEDNYNLRKDTILELTNNTIFLELFNLIITQDRNRNPKLVAHFILKDMQQFIYKNNLEAKYGLDHAQHVAELIDLLQSKTINLPTAQNILNVIIHKPEKTPMQIVKENNWILIRDEKQLEAICRTVIEDNPQKLKTYKSGKKRVFQALIKDVLKVTNDCADIRRVVEIMERLLNQ